MISKVCFSTRHNICYSTLLQLHAYTVIISMVFTLAAGFLSERVAFEEVKLKRVSSRTVKTSNSNNRLFL